MNAENRPGSTKKVSWSVVRDFTHQDSGITVRVSKSDAFRPRYSVQTGMLKVNDKEETYFAPHIGLYAKIENFKVESLTPMVGILEGLLIEAHNFIFESMQAREDEIWKAKTDREQRGTYQAPPTNGLKNLTKRDRERRQNANRD